MSGGIPGTPPDALNFPDSCNKKIAPFLPGRFFVCCLVLNCGFFVPGIKHSALGFKRQAFL